MNSNNAVTDRGRAGPTPVNERMLAPDLGRGFMLLLIVIAHAPSYLFSADTFLITRPLGGSLLDDIANAVGLLFVDNRSYPMFGGLFGFGLAFMASRQLARGIPEAQVRRSIRRRCWFLVLFGFVHLVFIGGADILGLYGVAGLLFGWLLFRPEKTKKRAIAALFSVYLVLIPLFWIWILPISKGGIPFGSQPSDYTYVQMLVEHSIAFPMVVAVQALLFPMLLPIVVGIWLGGKNWLQQPEQFRAKLRRFAAGGISVSVLGALPLALVGARLWSPPPALLDWSVVLSLLTGLAGGFGYLALIALLSMTARKAVPKITSLLSAVGKRSLTFYIYQEGLLVLLLSPVAFGFGGSLSSAGVFAVAILIWLSGVCISSWLDKRGLPGPADALLRKLAYRH